MAITKPTIYPLSNPLKPPSTSLLSRNSSLLYFPSHLKVPKSTLYGNQGLVAYVATKNENPSAFVDHAYGNRKSSLASFDNLKSIFTTRRWLKLS
ncbi:hypothetical protein OROMI_019883 [Orobanche minor]